METQMAAISNPGIDPAFPPPGGGNKQGLTIRDFFAAHALAGLCVNAGRMDEPGMVRSLAEEAYRLADATVEARKGVK